MERFTKRQEDGVVYLKLEKNCGGIVGNPEDGFLITGDAIDEFARLEDEGERLKKAVCAPDYEKMFKEHNKEHESIYKENSRLREEKEALEAEFLRMRAQLDMVYLIFGGVK